MRMPFIGFSPMELQERKQVLYYPTKRHNNGPQQIVANSPCLLLLFGCEKMPNKEKKKMHGDHKNGLNLSGEKDRMVAILVGGQTQQVRLQVRLRQRAGRNKSKG
jgi:hypothetical protein